MPDKEEREQETKSKTYSVGEVVDLTGISAFTLRYYDKCGFFPNLYRGKNNVRQFSENDLHWLKVVDSLRKSGLSIEGIQYFVRLSIKGSSTLLERRNILQAQETTLEYQIAEIQENLAILKNEINSLSSLIGNPENTR